MEKYSQEIIDNIKHEPEVSFTLFLPDDGENYSQEIVDNVKHEPEVNFTLFLPDDDPETDDDPEVKEVKIVLRKFDKNWKSRAKLFGSYFACGKCRFASQQSGNLDNHLKVCGSLKKCENCRLKSKSENIIECGFCDQQFKCKNCKSIHISQVHCKGSTWICSRCDYKTSNKNHLKQHYQIHVKKFSCQTCKQNFSNQQRLTSHQQNHRHGEYATDPGIKFECSTCNKSFPTKAGLSQHEKKVHSKLRFYCDVCGKTMKTKTFLRQHMQTHFKVPCPICNHLLAEHRLQSHIDKHTATPKFKCDDCAKVCYNQNELNIHKRSKHEIEQVQCDLCNKMFKNKLLLRLHMRIHLIVSCPVCSKSMSKPNLSQHMKIHTSKRESLACTILKCQQKFSSIKELEDHRQIHVGTKSYKCPNCNYQSKSLRDMKSHMNRRH